MSALLSEEERKAQLDEALKDPKLNELQRTQMQVDYQREAAEREAARKAAQDHYEAHKGRR